jgi:hypothetical protein
MIATVSHQVKSASSHDGKTQSRCGLAHEDAFASAQKGEKIF